MKAASTLVVAAALVVAGGCARSDASSASRNEHSPAAPSASASPSPSLTAAGFEPAVVAPTDLEHLRVLPADAKFRTPYPFDLYTHCGLELAGFAGSVWRAEKPIHNGLPGYLAGTMELLDANSARFVIDRRYFEAPVEVVVFRRTAATLPHCK